MIKNVFNKLTKHLEENNENFKFQHTESDLALNERYQIIIRFKNDYGASIIHHYGSYGSQHNLLELGVIKFKNPNEIIGDSLGKWELCYDTPLTDDVLGYLTYSDIIKALNEIKMLNREYKRETQ